MTRRAMRYLSLLAALLLSKGLLLRSLLNDHIHVVIVVGHGAKIAWNGLDVVQQLESKRCWTEGGQEKKRPNLGFAGK